MKKSTIALAASLSLLVLPALAADNGTAPEAKAMLEKAVTAVKTDKTKALGQFSSGEGGFKDRDLYVFCIGSDGTFNAHPNKALLGKDARGLKDSTGKAFAVEMISVASEGSFSQVDYTFPRPGGTDPAPKSSYVTKISDEVCGVGYYK
ncbi:Chemotaxis protein [Rhodovastum atsumiense]|uniref:Chemotaxis protein n=1 Tax=Rhodovastum atsumiense TaxID=504468 RepID=A0A5M6IPH2_9PROT|nr:cache domain-containing protein [Rhodovastum atsumiense]KAA5610170.1 chemotaxis protein [Rhodovastum atsumiense]CAH2599263.1 Chemotaxis protein [Rhodovastum atsumiense]